MRPFLYFIILSASLVAVLIFAIIKDIPTWCYYIPVATGLISLAALFRGIILPARTVARGMELIKAQDYNNRLVKVGESNADSIVVLFNSLIDKLRGERLLNREHESLLKLLIDASPMGMIMLDFNKKVSMVNPSFLKMSGIHDPGELIGVSINDIKWDLLPDMLNIPLGKSDIIRKGNFRIYRGYHLNFIQEGFKREFYLLESLTDEIMKAERMAYEKVIRTISHEVNNSIGGIRSVLEIVSEIIEDREIKKVIESCDNRCEIMCGFIRDYSEVVKVSRPMKRQLDLGEELDKMVPFIRGMLPENISFIFSRPQEPQIIEADMGQLQQAIINIVKNAAESIEEKGKIEMSIRSEKRTVELTIANNGSKITEEMEKEIFTPFFTTKPDGKGIGLTFVREVLSLHNAVYSLKTDQDGITRFRIRFSGF